VVVGFAALLAALIAYYEVADDLWRWSNIWWDVLWLALVLLPAVFALVLLALPVRRARGLLLVGLAFAVLTAVLTIAHVDVFANFSRLAATTLLGWWFLEWFETVAWVVLVACIIPWVDAYSVFFGPTKTILNHHVEVFNVLAFAFLLPGGGSFQLGVPDLLFFALFLGAAARFGLRVYGTWVALIAMLGLTMAATIWWNLSGLPALPGIALGFLIPNADLLWRRLRGQPGLGDRANVSLGRTADDA
jgi:hypothetical protein